jgi:uncharacterized protein YbjT (DUF2867 family)
VPFVALRPGAFFDQVTRFGGDPFSKGRLRWLGSPRIPLTFVLTPDLASYLAAAIDAPGIEGQRIDIGWDRPVSMQQVAEISGRLLNKRIRVSAVPGRLIHTMGTILGPINPMVKDLASMIDWFQTGRYVADTTRQQGVFGPLPTAEDAIARLVTSLGHAITP